MAYGAIVYPYRGLGQSPRPALHPGLLITTQQSAARQRHLRALEVVAAGLLSAGSLILFARGRDKAAYVLGTFSALAGAVLSFARIYSDEER